MQALAPFPLFPVLSMTDLQALGTFASLLLASVAAGEGLRVLGWAPESSRRVVHIGVGLTVAASPTWFTSPGPIYGLAAVFVVGNAVALGLGWFRGMHAIERRSVGTVVFPIALIVALVLCWGPVGERIWAMQVAFAVLALADPAASWVGTRVGRPRDRGGLGEKSWAGSLAFAVVTFVVTLLLLHTTSPASVRPPVLASLTVALLATVAEALGRRGWDNLWIVLAALVALRWWEGPSGDPSVGLAALAAAAAFAALTWRVGVLSGTGALAGSLLAWGLVVEVAWGWWAPALAFFVLSSALSLAGRGRKARSEVKAQKGSRRDAAQVLANGGVGMALLAATLFGGHLQLMFWGFVGSFAAAAADTWGTEVGTWVRGRTRWLGVGRSVPPGTSGGMSLAGTAALVAGAASVVGAAAAAMPLLYGASIPGLIGAGVVGALVDTVLGATVQARYRLPDGSLTEKTEAGGVALPRACGVRWIDNDVVNWACTLTGGLGGAIAWGVLG